MTLRQEILSRFSGEAPADPIFVPDLTLWYDWHQSKGTLPEKWKNHSLHEIAGALGVPTWLTLPAYRVETPGVEIESVEERGERTVRAETAAGSLMSRWTLGPDGDWWQVEYPVKSADDLAAVLALVGARTYVLDTAAFEVWDDVVGDDGVVALELPRRPYSDLLHEFLGWNEGLLFLKMPEIDDINAVLEAKLQRLVVELAQLPGDMVFSPDNLDGQFISPRAFEKYLAPSYRRTADALHLHGKRLIAHIGGPIKRLFTSLVDAGVDGFEGVAGPPQSDLSLAEAREGVGPGPTLWGGIPQDCLLGTYEWQEFELCVAQAVQQSRGDNAMMLGVADRVPVAADQDRLEAIAELVNQHLCA